MAMAGMGAGMLTGLCMKLMSGGLLRIQSYIIDVITRCASIPIISLQRLRTIIRSITSVSKCFVKMAISARIFTLPLRASGNVGYAKILDKKPTMLWPIKIDASKGSKSLKESEETTVRYPLRISLLNIILDGGRCTDMLTQYLRNWATSDALDRYGSTYNAMVFWEGHSYW